MQISLNQTILGRNKLLLLACLVGIGSILLVGIIAVDRSSRAILIQGQESLQAIQLSRTSQVEDYFRNIRAQVKELARSRMIGQAAIEFSTGFQNLEQTIPRSDQLEDEVNHSLERYYYEEFSPRLQRDFASTTTTAELIPTERSTRLLQWQYIAKNPNKVGEKETLLQANTECEYNRVHGVYHPILRSYLKSFEFYDLFLFDLDGNVIYSVFKETDFATNFLHGPYCQTNLGDALRKALASTSQEECFLQDFTGYLPSYGAPASFIASPIFFDGRKVGVLAFQMPLKRINDILQRKEGLGHSGESYLVGSDLLMRTDSPLCTESTILKVEVDSASVRRAIQGESGTCICKSYQGRKVVSSFSPVDIDDLAWVAIAEIDLDELLAPAYRLRNSLFYSGLTTAVLAILVSLVCARLLSNERRERDLLHSACIDKLTGLPNRLLFLNRLERAFQKYLQNPKRSLTILFLDFDRFKAVNDTYGHAIGDQLLRAIADRLRASLNLEDHFDDTPRSISAARLGGDEFVVMLDFDSRVKTANPIASALLKTFDKSYTLDGHVVESTASIGIAECNEQYRSAEELLRNADAAMYEAKKRGKACSVTFDTGIQSTLYQRRCIENDLSVAIRDQQFALDFQPIVDLDSGELHSVEASVSWHHPKRGFLTANQFLPIAEEIRLTSEIYEWLIQQACRQQAKWMRLYGQQAPKFISVLYPGRRCFSTETLGIVEGAIHRSGIAPQNLQMQFSEEAIIGEIEKAAITLNALRSVGVRISLDDFSRSHSQLVSGRALPIDSVTIGSELISMVDQSQAVAALVHSLALFASNLQLDTVAEGIDSPEQMLAVRSIGCQLGKGTYFGSAMSHSEIDSQLRTGHRRATTISGAIAFLPSLHEGLAIVAKKVR